MTHLRTLRKLVFLSTLLVLCSVITAGVYTRASKIQKKQKDHARTYDAARVTAAPVVRSAIKGLEISGVSLIHAGTSEAAVVIDVINHRDEDVMTLDFVAGTQSNSSGLAIDGLLEEHKSMVIIPRHSLKSFTWNLGSIMEGATIFLTVAVFSDGKEEGDKHFLDGIKKTRLRHQQKRREGKVANGGQQ